METPKFRYYGNGFKNGYTLCDLANRLGSKNLILLLFTSQGHEWFYNTYPYKDSADMWIHESFTNYSESLSVEY
jgi:hypothetical protein